ncbi:hypothetical protein EPA93_40370 [Ktedonosporobacter rubrisoli]|uniref:Uncharacterized protein n=1 Tax=Ktedonosporobacter rubrisoli TaxID=2509675 RepID=A0A4P6K2H1_KTERU|nr:hypothetical protein [Ktedonosporobacter rubrisoli]QBD81900.1 hypothetical protein EPA93_40370 [Ktedonosporobacter rubrisoli]
MHFANLLDTYRFEKYVLEVAIATLERGGVTSKLATYQLLEPVNRWSFPKYPSKTAILAPDIDIVEELKTFIQLHEQCLREPDCSLGTWINPATKYYYLDITMSCADLEEARREALLISQSEGRKIVAIYNSWCGRTVYL